MKGLVEVGVVREWRRGRRDLAETWFKLELDRAVAMTCKPQPSQGVLCDTVLDILPLYGTWTPWVCSEDQKLIPSC